jgi:hypothetical protein
MGKVAPFQRLRTDRQYSEEELKDLAFAMFWSVTDARSERIATVP